LNIYTIQFELGMLALGETIFGFSSSMKNNQELSQYLQESGILTSVECIQAFSVVDRRDYVPNHLQHLAYRDQPIRDGFYHLSAPCIYAAAIETLNLHQGNSFLNVGSGTGYLSTLVSQLIGKDAINHGCDINADVINFAREILDKVSLSLNSGEPLNIEFVEGNGLCIEANKMRYDRIYVGFGCRKDTGPEKYKLQNLLEIGGLMVGPFDDELLRIERISETEFHQQRIAYVCFAPVQLPDEQEMMKIISFPRAGWTPEIHRSYPRAFQEAVLTVLLSSRRQSDVTSLLPAQLWIEVFRFLRRDAFVKPKMRRKCVTTEEEALLLTKFGVVSSVVSFCAGLSNQRLGGCCFMSVVCGAFLWKLCVDGKKAAALSSSRR